MNRQTVTLADGTTLFLNEKGTLVDLTLSPVKKRVESPWCDLPLLGPTRVLIDGAYRVVETPTFFPPSLIFLKERRGGTWCVTYYPTDDAAHLFDVAAKRLVERRAQLKS